MAIVSGALTPAAVSTRTASCVPESFAGHRKLTNSGETNITGTASPLIFTRVPASPLLRPEGSTACSSASHLPLSLPIAPGLHSGLPSPFNTGAPESASMLTCAIEDLRSMLVALNVTRCLPASEASGVHSNHPLRGSKDAPLGRPAADRSTGNPQGSDAVTWKRSALPNLANWSPGAFNTGTDDGST